MIDDSPLENYLADLQNVPLVEAGRVREDGAISDANVFGTEPDFTPTNSGDDLRSRKISDQIRLVTATGHLRNTIAMTSVITPTPAT